MNRFVPPKQKRAPAKGALRKLQLQGGYHFTACLAKILGASFWFFEQRRGRLQDWFNNMESDN